VKARVLIRYHKAVLLENEHEFQERLTRDLCKGVYVVTFGCQCDFFLF
jgi:hypothetical protein